MDLTTYEQLYTYLSTLHLPPSVTAEKQRTFCRLVANYLVRGKYLYRKNRQSPNHPLRVVSVRDVELILRDFHEDPFAGHFGNDRTYQKIAERYYWPDMRKHVYEFVRSCDTCQRRGPPVRRPEPMYPLRVGEPFERIGIDMVGPLPVTPRGNRFIIVATDYLTKWPEARPTTDQTSLTAASFLYDHIFTRHGAPKELLSDRGRTFLNQTLDELCTQWKVQQTFASTYHPQTNGLVERFNKTLAETLAKLCIRRPTDWDEMVPAALFAYRTAKHETTRQTPFFMVYGREATYPSETIVMTYPSEHLEHRNESMDINKLVQRTLRLYELNEARNEARLRIEREQERQKKRHDKTVRPQLFAVNDLVLKHDTALAQTRSGKFKPKWLGPFRIHSVLGNGVYRLATTNGETLDDPVNAKRLKLYHQRVEMEPQVIIDVPSVPFLALCADPLPPI